MLSFRRVAKASREHSASARTPGVCPSDIADDERRGHLPLEVVACGGKLTHCGRRRLGEPLLWLEDDRLNDFLGRLGFCNGGALIASVSPFSVALTISVASLNRSRGCKQTPTSSCISTTATVGFLVDFLTGRMIGTVFSLVAFVVLPTSAFFSCTDVRSSFRSSTVVDEQVIAEDTACLIEATCRGSSIRVMMGIPGMAYYGGDSTPP